jgi:hypothetical protein
MKHKTRPVRPATFPLTIGTPYGEIKLELEVCRDCSEHFNFRILDTPPLLSTRQAEPFLYRLMHTMDSIGTELWLELLPEQVKHEIDSNIYKARNFVVPAAQDLN